MKNLNLIFATILFALFTLTSCEKEEMNTLTPEITTNETMTSVDMATNLSLENGTIITIDREKVNVAKSRNNESIFFEETVELSAGEASYLWYETASMPDPTEYKVQVVITPEFGNPDLYLFGYDPKPIATRAELLLNNSLHTDGSDSLIFRKADFMRNDYSRNEEYAVIGIAPRTNTRFTITFAIIPVDCKEEKPRQLIQSTEGKGVCGCNGQQYSNSSDAFNNGVTSWTEGNCKITNGVYQKTNGATPYDYIFVNIDKLEIGFVTCPDKCDVTYRPLKPDGVGGYNGSYYFGKYFSYYISTLENNNLQLTIISSTSPPPFFNGYSEEGTYTLVEAG